MGKTLLEELKEKQPSLVKRAEMSPLAGIRMFCLECVGLSRAEVVNCTAPSCPLYPFRMGRRPSTGTKREVSPALAEARSKRFKEMHEKRRAEAGAAEELKLYLPPVEEQYKAAIEISNSIKGIPPKNPFDLAAGLLKKKV
jgi:hypothetical protein